MSSYVNSYEIKKLSTQHVHCLRSDQAHLQVDIGALAIRLCIHLLVIERLWYMAQKKYGTLTAHLLQGSNYEVYLNPLNIFRLFYMHSSVW